MAEFTGSIRFQEWASSEFSMKCICTGAIGVEEIKRFFDLLPLLRRQALFLAFVLPVTRGRGRLIALESARLHRRIQSSAGEVLVQVLLPTTNFLHRFEQ